MRTYFSRKIRVHSKISLIRTRIVIGFQLITYIHEKYVAIDDVIYFLWDKNAQCGNDGSLLSHFFGKNFVEATILLN